MIFWRIILYIIWQGFKDKLKAKETYEKLIFDYNSSLYSVEARKRQKILKDELGS